MKVTGKNIGRFNHNKWQKAFSLMERDYIAICKQAPLYFAKMTKKEEEDWERDTIYYYYNGCTVKEMDALLELNTWEV